jgi:hypothetical protein
MIRLRKNPQDPEKDIKHRHIISGWFCPDESLIISLLDLASLQRGIKLRDFHFHFEEGADEVQTKTFFALSQEKKKN